MPKTFTPDFAFDASSVTIRNLSDEQVRALSMRYNAAISALEVRALRGKDPALLAAIGKRAVHVVAVHPIVGRVEWVIHFETASLACPCEVDAADGFLVEVVVLRGLRFEEH